MFLNSATMSGASSFPSCSSKRKVASSSVRRSLSGSILKAMALGRRQLLNHAYQEPGQPVRDAERGSYLTCHRSFTVDGF